jgi:dolichyl-phosphate-mannose-protein mannosyltransferase
MAVMAKDGSIAERDTSLHRQPAGRHPLGGMVALLALGLALRVAWAGWFGHSGDLATFMSWARRLATVGPADFWSGSYWCDYLPGYLLVLWPLGWLARVIPSEAHILLFKIPSILADLATAYLIWRATRAKLGRGHLWLPTIYLFNPAILFNATLWGQVDSFHALFLVWGLYLTEARRPGLAGAVLGFAVAVKPHSVALLPVVLVMALRRRFSWGQLALGGGMIVLVFAATFVPFAGTAWPPDVYRLIEARFSATMGEYGFATVNAMNFWYLLGYNWVEDGVILLGGYTLGEVAAWTCLLGIAAVLAQVCERRRVGRSVAYQAAGLVYIIVFLFVTRAHERHVFPAFAFLTMALAWRRAALLPLGLLSATYCVNLFYAWRYILTDPPSSVLCAPVLGKAICALNLLVLPLSVLAFSRWGVRIVAWVRRPREISRSSFGTVPDGCGSESPGVPLSYGRGTEGHVFPLPYSRGSDFGIPLPYSRGSDFGDCPLPYGRGSDSLRLLRYRHLILLGILVFAGVTRLARLNAPDQRYFDEVYHAYTAEQWVRGNTDAWLWSTQAPDEGCAYEWTHPPLAKLAMAQSMRWFGIHPWAWRLPGALCGLASILLIYVIAQGLWRHTGIALLAAAFAALDILPLFASRIAMNDAYCVAFILLAVALALRRGWEFAAPLAAGLALACKWTTLYALPLLGLIHLLRPRDDSRLASGSDHRPVRISGLILLYATVTPTLYVASYLPFFQAGHPPEQCVELHRQMWWYHTNLDAEHPYASPAWRWPLLSKVVWCHTGAVEAEDDPSSPEADPARVRNVYAWGNPIIWCAGLGAVLYALLTATRASERSLIIVTAGYLAFWAPWLASPRIMFLYHYLPSLPFLYLALGWALVRTGLSRYVVGGVLIASLVAFALLYPYVAAVPLPESWTPTAWAKGE